MRILCHVITAAGVEPALFTSRHASCRDGLPVLLVRGHPVDYADHPTRESTPELLREAYRQGIEDGLRALPRIGGAP